MTPHRDSRPVSPGSDGAPAPGSAPSSPARIGRPRIGSELLRPLSLRISPDVEAWYRARAGRRGYRTL